ncbi:MAG: hydantoinase B/oxoprolinase family protein [Mesorhizobium sp.]|uniref:hydantoinase B/oxoprolinase family protein n=1 Tax=Mesorhizobium sp. TaxID=1871066 RepID=UPI001ACDB059|nr:hydantoinase B/oxoprolinase family protein [Mesorhizobium sp.]MBN9217731.1 hydantoinase B/oxoprolinase family protein [Mesorhizobium sp.]
MTDTTEADFDPYMTAIISNRIDGIIREMTNTLLRAARSGVINGARDFSCSICTGDNRLLASAEGLPIHIFGSHMQTQAMCDFAGDELAEGDCYLHNDPYSGNTHAGDHTYLVPVFIDGEHLFTAVAKAHQADIGNALPTTYMAGAKDQYAEGALIFPAVRIQRNHEMVEDVVRMCRSRIRVPDQWYGDFLAGIGAARIAERRLKELCAKYGKEQIKAFVRHWFAYSEQRMIQAIRALPRVTLTNSGAHDPFGDLLPEGIPLKVTIDIDPEKALIELDLTDNGDNVECGFNESEACTSASTITGIFNALDSSVPRNYGSFSRIRLKLRDGCVAGRPKFPHSCSVATTNVADRLVNIVQSAFAELGEGWGLAEGGLGMGAGCAVVSGKDHRADNAAYVNQLFLANAGGPGSPSADGWITYGLPVAAGLMYRDSVEIDELKHPIAIRFLRLMEGTGGAGKFRGAPAMEVAYGPKEQPMDVIWPCDGTVYPPKGVRGGGDGFRCRHWKVGANGQEEELPNIAVLKIRKDEYVRGNQAGGGGYGNPLERDPRRVLSDVIERYETLERANDIYGVVFSGSDPDTMGIDEAATARRRAELRRAAA